LGVASDLPDALPPDLSKISLQPVGYTDIIRPVGYNDKASWLLFSECIGGAEMAESAWMGGRLRELREQKGLTQTQLAELVGVKRDAVARWEADVREPGWSNVVALASALGVDCTAFLQEPAPRPETGRGRPRKAEEPPTPKRPRGRPRKEK
jgi:DNA-binding XRE family transcriptional regulator